MADPVLAVLRNDDDGYEILVRALDVLEAARQDAAAYSDSPGELVPDEQSVREGWWRAVPCDRNGHDDESAPGGWCDGKARSHYVVASGAGRGAFRAAVVRVVPAEDLDGAR